MKARILAFKRGLAPMYKLVLLDYAMPEMNGTEVSLAIHKLFKDINQKAPFICCFTAYAEPSFQYNSFNAGMDAFMTKPLQNDELNELLRVLNDWNVNYLKQKIR